MANHLVFIASGGRTGTKSLGDLLSSVIEDCHSEHEPDLFLGLNRTTYERLQSFGLWQMVLGRAFGLTGVRVTGTRLLTRKVDLPQAAASLRAQRRTYHARTTSGLLIESYYAWWMVASHLSEIFPGCKTVGIVRDPRTWITSWQSHQPNRDRAHWTHLIPPGPLNAITLQDRQWADRWDQIGSVGRLAWQWRLINGELTKAEDAGTARIYRFEEIFKPDSQDLLNLVSYASSFPGNKYPVKPLDQISQDRRNSSKARGDEWTDWNRQELDVVAELCGPLLERFGYDQLT